MAPKEVPSRKEQPRQYDPSSLFELSPAEQEVFDSLTPEEQTIFSVFRQSFMLSSGDIPVQGTIAAAVASFFDLETKVLFSSYEGGKVPLFLQVIAAPRKHERVGKKEVGDEVESSKRQMGLSDAWKQWQTIFLKYTENQDDQSTKVLESLVDFLDRDLSMVSRKSPDRRVTGNQPHTSFLREFVLNDRFDSSFDRHIILLLQSWREVLDPHLVFYDKYVKNKQIESEVFAESQIWLLDKEKELAPGQNVIEVEANEQVPFLVQLFFQEFRKYPTYLDTTIMEVFDGIITQWKLKHPDQQFYPELGF